MESGLKAVESNEHSWQQRSQGLRGALQQVLALRQYHEHGCGTQSRYHFTNAYSHSGATYSYTCVQHFHVTIALLAVDRLRHY